MKSPYIWIKTKPRRTGFYWYRPEEDSCASVVYVFKDVDGHWSVRHDEAWRKGEDTDDADDWGVNYIVNEDGEFAGPIPEPREPLLNRQEAS